jgi:Kef-type K+ transport system membrane component KefB
MIDTQNQYTFMITLGAIIILTPLLKAVFDRIGISVLVGYLALGFTHGDLRHPNIRTAPRMF